MKLINTHLSSDFHKLRCDIVYNQNLGIVFQDIDLIKLNNNKIESIIELKTGKFKNTTWKPYVKSNFPTWNPNSLDDVNYLALCELTKILEANLFLFRTESNSLKNGIKIYKVEYNDKLNFTLHGTFSIEQIIKKFIPTNNQLLDNRHIKKVKDYYNPNISQNNNLYHMFNSNDNLRKSFYIECDGTWTMVISDAKTLKPIWIYIELIIDINIDLYNNKAIWTNYFFPAIEIHVKCKIPFSIIAYEKNLKKIDVYNFKNNNFELENSYDETDIQSFKEFYLNKLIFMKGK